MSLESPQVQPIRRSHIITIDRAIMVTFVDEAIRGVNIARRITAARLGFDPAAFAGHSLRAGFLTSAAAIFKMMDVSRHRSVDTLRGYVRDANAFRDHAGAALL